MGFLQAIAVKSLSTYHSRETLIVYLALYSLSEISDGAVLLGLLSIIGIENFPKENYNFNYSVLPCLMGYLSEHFPECSLYPFTLNYLSERQQVARTTPELRALRLTL